jgi:hypothetical protein
MCLVYHNNPSVYIPNTRALMAAADHADDERARRSWAEGEEDVDGGFAADHGIIDHLPSRVSPSKISQ